MGHWDGVKCPICKQSFSRCPHSVGQKERREREDAERALIRDEVLKMKREGLL